jgi:hypothetical protein
VSAQSCPDDIHYPGDVFEHIIVPETKDFANPSIRETSFAGIAVGIVLSAVYLDDQQGLKTGEVYDSHRCEE